MDGNVDTVEMDSHHDSTYRISNIGHNLCPNSMLD